MSPNSRLRSVCAMLALGISSVAVAQYPSIPSPGQSSTALQQALLQNPGLADQIRNRIQSSGLTPEQVRARLAASGYPTNLLDSYLGPSDMSQAPQPGATELAAVQALGLAPAPASSVPVDSGLMRARGDSTPAESLAVGNYVFGVDVFRRGGTQFMPTLGGPVPPDYRLGPGDQLVLILTGDVELAYALPVTREGFLVIPQVGQVFVANLTLDQLRDVMYTRLGKVYSSVRRGPDAKTHVTVSVANVRANQVYVLGEVKQPGAYQISALGTALTALYAAGGITKRADMRQIEVRRLDSVVATLDLYHYLLRGEKRNDIRLQTGDVIYVPLHGKRVQITGAVLRPAIYELTPEESLADLVRAAGGFNPDAALQRLSIYRILPVPDRGSGPYARAVVDVRLPLAPAPGADPPPPPGAPSNQQFGAVLVPALTVESGDSVVVDQIPSLDNSFYVTIVGAVNNPGRYPWRLGMTLRELMIQARGPRPWAYLHDAEIARLPTERSQGQLAQTLRVPLDSTYLFSRDTAGHYLGIPGPAAPASGAPEVVLQPYDNVLILLQPEFAMQQTVVVTGQVRFPGAYALASGKDRLADLIERAGGLTPLAYTGGIRFVRPFGDAGRINVDLDRALKQRDSRFNIVLAGGDSIVIPQFQPSVKVSGSVNAPSSVLWEKGKDLSYYLNAAGGPTFKADKGRIAVRYANGQVRTRHRFLFFRTDPEPGPGSEVTVPERDLSIKAPDLVTLLGVLGQFIAATVTLVVVSRK